MSYEKVNWLNEGESGAKPLNKTNLDIMDEGIKNLDDNKVEKETTIAEISLENNISISALVNKLKVEMLKIDNPVGHIRMETTNVNPATYLGFGTWQQWGQGRVPVGVDTTDSDFNAVEKTGGEKKHTMTIEELVTHRHEYHVKNTQGAGNSRETAARGSSATGEDDWRADPYTNYEGQGQPFNIQQQYITCYMWKRVA